MGPSVSRSQQGNKGEHFSRHGRTYPAKGHHCLASDELVAGLLALRHLRDTGSQLASVSLPDEVILIIADLMYLLTRTSSLYTNHPRTTYQGKLGKFNFLEKEKEVKTVFLGLDGSGKTTALYKLKLDDKVTTVPTIGFNVETIKYKKANITIWDIGGDQRIRSLWRHYLSGFSICYFVDASTCFRNRLEEAKNELTDLLKRNVKETEGVPILIFFNTFNYPGMVGPREPIPFAEFLIEFAFEDTTRPYCIMPCNSVTGEGLLDGFDWLLATLA